MATLRDFASPFADDFLIEHLEYQPLNSAPSRVRSVPTLVSQSGLSVIEFIICIISSSLRVNVYLSTVSSSGSPALACIPTQPVRDQNRRHLWRGHKQGHASPAMIKLVCNLDDSRSGKSTLGLKNTDRFRPGRSKGVLCCGFSSSMVGKALQRIDACWDPEWEFSAI